MREIKFRAQELMNYSFVYGHLIKIDDRAYILEDDESEMIENRDPEDDVWCIRGFIEVDPETIGQYTGYKDINGHDIYEGDYVTSNGAWGELAWFDGQFVILDLIAPGTFISLQRAEKEGIELKIISNIHDVEITVTKKNNDVTKTLPNVNIQ